MLFVYSGNFLVEAEKDQYDQTRIQMGLTDELFAYPLEAGAEFIAPEVILSYTNKGLSRLSQQYHHCIMNHICQGKYVHANRPVLINSWEAAYFDFTGDTIVELAKEAKALGIDMVVMDDGWFGKRNDDNSSLGDWYVNEEKLGGTLTKLIERVNAEGVKFGIWIELKWSVRTVIFTGNIRNGQSQFQAASLSVPETSWSLIFQKRST